MVTRVRVTFCICKVHCCIRHKSKNLGNKVHLIHQKIRYVFSWKHGSGTSALERKLCSPHHCKQWSVTKWQVLQILHGFCKIKSGNCIAVTPIEYDAAAGQIPGTEVIISQSAPWKHGQLIVGPLVQHQTLIVVQKSSQSPKFTKHKKTYILNFR